MKKLKRNKSSDNALLKNNFNTNDTGITPIYLIKKKNV